MLLRMSIAAQVPVKHEVVGRFAKETQPRVWQVRTLCCIAQLLARLC